MTLPDLSVDAWRVFRRNLTVFRRNWIASSSASILEPVIWLLGMGLWMGKLMNILPEGVEYFVWLSPGYMATTAMWGAAYECTYGSYTRMATQRLYDSFLATPCSVDDVVVGEILWGAFRGLTASFSVLVVGAAFGGFGSVAGAVAALPICFAVGALFAALTLCFVAVADGYEFFNYWLIVVLTPMSFLANAYFPLSTLPESAWPVVRLSQLLPLSHGVDAVRSLTLGSFGGPQLLQALLVFALVLPASLLAIRLLRRRLVG